MGRLGLNEAVDYLVLLAAEAPEGYDRAARKGLARLLDEVVGAHARRGRSGAQSTAPALRKLAPTLSRLGLSPATATA
jgi:hypothetical protein